MNFASPFVLLSNDEVVATENIGEEELAVGWDASIPLVEDEPVERNAQVEPSEARASAPSVPSPSKKAESSLKSLSGWNGYGKAKTPTARSEKASLRFAPEVAHETPSYHSNKLVYNIVSLKLSSLKDLVPIHTGDIITCVCGAVLSAISKPSFGSDGTRWTCEFCNHVNVCDIVREEQPISESVDYILKPATQVEASEDNRRIIFCVDTSGSMCVSTEVPGKFALKGKDASNRDLLGRTFVDDGSHQYFPGQQRNVTYVSRLQSMQGAIESQLTSMSRLHPARQVGIITFNSGINIIGEGTTDVAITGDRLSNRAELLKIAEDNSNLSLSIKHSREALSKKLFELEEGGQTALGPALLVAIQMASKTAGSQVIVCTDGLGNIGLGSLEGFDQMAESEKMVVENFYSTLAQEAKTAGVSVSVMTITGEECKLEQLSTVADQTGGDIERVNPLELKENFQAMLENAPIANNVTVTMRLHGNMGFNCEDQAQSTVVRELGNVNETSEVFFEFAEKPGGTVSFASSDPPLGSGSMADAGTPGPTELPFQLAVKFTKSDGMVVLRVLSKMKPVTTDASVAEKDINVALCAANAAQTTAKLAQEGKYEDARMNAYAWRKKMARTVASPQSSVHQQRQFSNFQSAMGDLDTRCLMAQRSDVSPAGPAMNFVRMSSQCHESPSSRLSAEETRSRRTRRTDEDSREIFKCKNVSSDAFQ